MERRRLVVYALIGVAVVAAALLAAVSRLDIANILLTVTVLVIATLSLEASWPLTGKLVIERQQELRHVGDLFFFSYPEPAVADGYLPRDVLFEMYVAVANVGGRKSLLLGVSLEAFLDAQGQPVSSPMLPVPVLAEQYRQWQSRDLLAASLHIQSETKMPPFVLDPDEVLSLRLRARHGIDWSPSWDLAALKDVAESLARPVTQGRMLLIYRRGPSLVRETVVLPLVSEAHEDFAQRLAKVTANFTTMPSVQARAIDPYGTDSGFPIPR